MVRAAFHVLQEVARQENAGPELVPHLEHQVQHPGAPVGIQAIGGLVQEEQPGTVNQGLGQLHPLAHPCGIPRNRPVAGLIQPHEVQHLVSPVPGLGRSHPREFAPEGHLLEGRDILDEGVVFRHVAHLFPETHGLGAAQGDPQNPPLTRIGLQEPQEGLEEGGLPGPIRAQDSRHPWSQLQVYPLQGHPGAIADLKLLETDHRLTPDRCPEGPPSPHPRPSGPSSGAPGAQASWCTRHEADPSTEGSSHRGPGSRPPPGSRTRRLPIDPGHPT